MLCAALQRPLLSILELNSKSQAGLNVCEEVPIRTGTFIVWLKIFTYKKENI